MKAENEALLETMNYLLTHIDEFEEGFYQLPQFLEPRMIVFFGRLTEVKQMAREFALQAFKEIQDTD